jgi:hypothetical protein
MSDSKDTRVNLRAQLPPIGWLVTTITPDGRRTTRCVELPVLAQHYTAMRYPGSRPEDILFEVIDPRTRFETLVLEAYRAVREALRDTGRYPDVGGAPLDVTSRRLRAKARRALRKARRCHSRWARQELLGIGWTWRFVRQLDAFGLDGRRGRRFTATPEMN